MNEIVGSHDILLVTLDTLRYDVAAALAAAGELPNLLPPGVTWERRHSPGSFTYASHAAMFAGFLPTPVTPGPHPRLFAATFPGSESTAGDTWVFDAPDLPTGLAQAGYHTVCIGGVGFFNKLTPLGSALPGLFAESHWRPEFGVTNPSSLEHQIDCAADALREVERPVFLFVNVSALHQPNHHHLPGAGGDSVETHAAALRYVDRHIARLYGLMRRRRPCLVIVCSDHGTAYGEDGHVGHRIAHEVVWTVPYTEFVLESHAAL
ncbi:STM4013/SEN3800 family hydrolase [Nonomuraea sp. NN258]|uniref:STM4013/SEN3800 family hydrolase n=1 Tax=Nonomuraea antri TaxID=2730852 RepID=UPI0015683EEB|nr:STM4013/SEN3800 family hydrolase [Nonomuraea antri]NRQ35676.1 STM4013/SEN3800 family hydrolase [Nonomuraea antri]